MGWFDKPVPAPAPRESKYSMDKVSELLARFGMLRLGVYNPTMKVLITKVTWGTLPYLSNVNGGAPGSGDFAEVQTTLEMLTRTMEGYIRLQNSPPAPQNEELMRKGQQALQVFWEKISSTTSESLSEMSDYLALTDYLSGNNLEQ